MDIKTQIDNIISARKARGDAMRRKCDDLIRLEERINSRLTVVQDAAYAISDEKIRAQYVEMADSIDAGEIFEGIYQLKKRYSDAQKRFGREYISIATIGKERQGKSQFLQSVSQLKNEIIPAYDADSCTGATSVIWNDTSMQPDSVRAEISFKKPGELVELVKSYVSIIDTEFFSNRALEFGGIGLINLNQLKGRMVPGNVDHENAYKYLKVIKDHFNEIRDLFGQAPYTSYDPEEIKTYVAQNNGKAPDDPERENYYNYLAVSRTDIYCRFYTDVGKIRLVDTIGIGATQHGIVDAMLDTVNRESDAAIVVTKPISGVQDVDQKLYKILREQFAGRDTSKWLFYLVNLHKGQNDKTVGTFYDDIVSQNWAVAGCKIADSSDADEVRDGFVLPMLNTLLHNMDAIDEAYIAEIELEEKKLYRIVEKFKNSLGKIDTDKGPGKDAYKKGIDCFTDMSTDLKKTVKFWNREKHRPNAVLWNRVQAILNNIDDIIPSAQQIDEISATGTMTGEQLWEACLHQVRNKLTDQFIAIDDALEAATLKFKNSLVRSLYKSLSQMTGAESIKTDENADPDADEEDDEFADIDMTGWLKEMMDRYLSGYPEYDQIRKAFDFLYKFEFNTRAQLIQVVRKNLYIINPICEEYAKTSTNFSAYDEPGDAIYFFLTSRMSVIEDELRYHLRKLHRTPNEAFYAAAEEFYDRLIFSSDMSDGKIVSMEHVWGSFFQEFGNEIWKEQAQKQEEVKKLARAYEEMKETLKQYLEDARGAQTAASDSLEGE